MQEADENAKQKTEKTLSRPTVPFNVVDAGHTFVRVGEEMNWDLSNVEQVLKRIQNIEYGLDAEVEFAAIVSWLGKCRLAHRLDQSSFSSYPADGQEIPDLQLVFENNSNQFSVLVEVKSTQANRLKLKPSYLQGLRQYAEMAGHPLLIAWKPRKIGLWLLVDPCIAVEDGANRVIELGEGLKHNLMSGLAGDFAVNPYSGCGLYLEAARTSEKNLHPKGFEAEFRIDRAEFIDQLGKKLNSVPESVMATLYATMEYTETVSEDRIRWSFTSKEGLVFAQNILRTVVGMAKPSNEKIHWKHVGKQLDQILARDSLLAGVQTHIGKTIMHLLYQHPIEWPEFIPENCRLRPEPPETVDI